MNKFLGKKGQGAMEYLMTYGWAILVVMIVGVVLWQLGIFNLGGSVGKTVSGFSAVKPVDWVISTGKIIWVNGEGTRIAIKTITLSEASGCTVTAGIGGANEVLDIGEAKEITDDLCGAGTSGSRYRVKVTVNYNKTIGAITQDHSSIGTLSGGYE